MFQVERVSPLPGHTADIGMAMYEHNQRFHVEPPHNASVFYLVTGPWAGQFQWAMGPTTFGLIGDRPADAAHNGDWSSRVLADGKHEATEYWTRVDDLSYAPEGMTPGARPISVIRRFEVVDVALFRKVQRQVMEVMAAAGSAYPRTMYQRRFLYDDGWNWVAITSYPSYAELDDQVDFEATFRARFGDRAFATFQEEFAQAITGRDDTLRELVTGM